MISELDWVRILAVFPVERRASVRSEVEIAREKYVADQKQKPGEQRKLWQRLAKLLQSAAVTELRQIAPRIELNNLPDPGFIDPLSPDREWLAHLTEYLTKAPPVARAYADLCKPRERFYAALFRTGTNAGLKLSVSATGPLVKFVQDVSDDFFTKPVTGEAIKKAVRRELSRRRIGAATNLSGQGGGFIGDAQVITAGKSKA